MRVCMHPLMSVHLHKVLMPAGCQHEAMQAPHPSPGDRSCLYRAMAAVQQPGSTLQCRASMSPSQLNSADRTQRSPEIWLIGWRFFIALYWSDGRSWRGRAVCCVAAPEQSWTQSSCCWQAQGQPATVGTVVWALHMCTGMAGVSMSVYISLCSLPKEVSTHSCAHLEETSYLHRAHAGKGQSCGSQDTMVDSRVQPHYLPIWGRKSCAATGTPKAAQDTTPSCAKPSNQSWFCKWPQWLLYNLFTGAWDRSRQGACGVQHAKRICLACWFPCSGKGLQAETCTCPAGPLPWHCPDAPRPGRHKMPDVLVQTEHSPLAAGSQPHVCVLRAEQGPWLPWAMQAPWHAHGGEKPSVTFSIPLEIG